MANDHEHPLCQWCNKQPVLRRPGEKFGDWKKRLCCSPECGRALHASRLRRNTFVKLADYEHPPCTICGGPVIRREHESVPHYRDRPTCGKECGIKFSHRDTAKTITAVKPVRNQQDEEAAIAAFIAAKGVENIRVRPGYAAPTQAAVEGDELRQRINKLKIPEPKQYSISHLFH